jgi:glycosyltransferase involved in cell wall biosynthesis
MRLGIVIYGSLETRSGGYLYDRKLVERLRRQGDQVEVISLPWRNYARHLADNLSPRLYRQLAELDIDVLLQDELNHPSLFWLNEATRRERRYPVIAIVHHLRSSELRPAWQNRFYRQVERRFLKSQDGFIFNSQSTRLQVSRLLGECAPPLKNSLVAYPAGDRLDPQISPAAIERRALQSGPLRLLFLGNIIPRKGLHTLLAAVARIPTRSWELEVAGSPDFEPGYARRVRRQAAQDGLAKNVHFRGALSDEALASLLQDCHVLVVPSSYEGFGIVYLEGMGAGLAAIATTSGGAGEIIAHGQNGFLVPPGDTEALADCLNALAQNRQLLLELSLAARRHYLAHPTWETSMGAIRDFLQTIALQYSPHKPGIRLQKR